MKLHEFAEEIRKNKGIFIDTKGRIMPILLWQDLIRADGFSKTIEHNLMKLEEREFVEMARRPITIPVRPVLKLTEADPYKAQDTTINTITFYPDTDEGWASPHEYEVRIHLYYYEK